MFVIKRNYSKRGKLLAILLFCYFYSPSLGAMEMGTVYTFEQISTTPSRLIVHLVLPENNPSETHLILRGVPLGIKPQVENMTSDGCPIKEESGTWLIPPNSHELTWEIPLLEVSEIDVSQQKSFRCGEFILISELSSLPRLENESKLPTIKITFQELKTVYPKPTPDGTISFPSNSEPPLFILMNAIEVKSISDELLTLTYLQDKEGMAQLLPDMDICMKGLKWLTSLVSENKMEENFTLGWCGISAERMAITGAAGYGILLVNYPNDMKPLHNALLLYVPFHEAFHQLSGNKQPTWVEESLASYYGSRAVEVALNRHMESSQLIDKFQKSGERFKEGLITINSQIKQGNQENYGAFYTKGISFWAAVENVLQKKNRSLDHYLKALLQMKYDSDNRPAELPGILGISSEEWRILCKDFLD